jgi:probable HAF family extracellular repeat protein
MAALFLQGPARMPVISIVLTMFFSGQALGQTRQATPQCKAATPEYTVADFGRFMARDINQRPALNLNTHVAAWSVRDESRITAALRGLGDTSAPVLPPIPDNSLLLGINDQDAVVGIIQSPQDLRDSQAFRYDHGSFRLLPTLAGGGTFSKASAVNAREVIVGQALTDSMQAHAVRWTRDQVRDLGTLQNGNTSYALDINRFGDIVGESNIVPNGKTHAVSWSRAGAMHDLGILPGGSVSSAQALNNRGVIVGYADNDEHETHAVVFAHGRIEDLGTLGDDPSSAASINDSGEIVGASAVADDMMRAFVWKQGRMYDLNKLIPKNSGWLLMSAYRINAKGQILVYGYFTGATHLGVLTPAGAVSCN